MVRVGIAFILSIFMIMFCIIIALSVCHRFEIATSITTLDHPFISISILILVIPSTIVVNKILQKLPNRWKSFLRHNPESARKLLQTLATFTNLSALAVFAVGTYNAFKIGFGTGTKIYLGIATLLWGIGRRVKRFKKRLEASTLSIKNIKSNLTEVDNRSSILLLRSFADDDFEYMNRQSFFREYFTISLYNLAPLLEGLTFEENICDAISAHGTIITIGHPGEELTPLGASRLYVPDNENWANYVSELMRSCALVVLFLGRSTGFCWELDQLSKGKLLAKVLLLIPPVSNKEKRTRWAVFLERLNATGLSPRCAEFNICKVLLMTFDSDLTCRPIYGKTKSTTDYSKPIADALKRMSEAQASETMGTLGLSEAHLTE